MRRCWGRCWVKARRPTPAAERPRGYASSPSNPAAFRPRAWGVKIEEQRMPEMTIRLETDPATGKKNIIVNLRSDDDALPHEHEQMHRALVERLLQGGLLKASE